MYQEYLAEFKAKHGPVKVDRKKSKSEVESSSATAKGANTEPGRPSLVPPNTGSSVEGIAHRPARAEMSPSSSSYFAPKPASISSYPFSGMSSPTNRDQYSPISASPMSTSLNREPSYEQSYQQPGMPISEHSAHDRPRVELQSTLPPSHSMQPHYRPQVDSAAPDPYSHTGSPSFPPPASSAHQPYGAPHQSQSGPSVPDIPSRRVNPGRDLQQLPSLTHEETAMSSDSSVYPPTPFPYQRPSRFPLDHSQGSKERILPHPVPSGVRNTPPMPGPSRVSGPEFGRATPPGLPGAPGAGGWPAILSIAAREGDDGRWDRGASPSTDPESRKDRPTDKPP